MSATREALIQTTLDLVEIASVIGEEGPLCDHVEARLRRTPGLLVQRHSHSLVVTPRQRAERPTVALVGHLDTVPPREDGPPRADETTIYGCGVSDMKAGLAVMVELAERLPFDQLGVNVVFVFYEREEGPYEENGLQPLLEGFPLLRDIDLAFCLEPSDNKLQLGSMGGIHCTLTFEGSRAHSARPWQGENAVHKAGPLLMHLHDRQRHPVEIGGLTFYEVMSVTMVSGAFARNVIPDELALNLNYRFAPGRSLEEAKADVIGVVAGRARIDWVDLSPSGPVCHDNPLLAPLRASHPEMPVEPKQAWTDVARFGLFGVEAANLGPGESAQAHQRNERCRIDLIVDGYHLFDDYLRRCGSPPA